MSNQPIEDGGPAFPWRYMDRDSMGEEVTREQGEGMSLRDWFAGQASEKDIQEMQDRHARLPEGVDEKEAYQWAAAGLGISYTRPTRQQARYLHADAMLAARKGEQPQ
jgi:hypothetical protein